MDDFEPQEAPVRIREVGILRRAVLRLVTADDRIIARAAKALGFDLPLAGNLLTAGPPASARLGPREWLIRDAPPLDALRERLEGITHHLCDVTPGRVAWRIDGADARLLLQAGCGLDLHPSAFGPRQCARTQLARVGAIITRLDPGFEVVAERSYEAYLWDWFAAAAADLTGGSPGPGITAAYLSDAPREAGATAGDAGSRDKMS